MIFYFSATGNCKYVATRIANRTNDRMISITDVMKKDIHSFDIKPNENIGIIIPTYGLGLPILVCEFLEKLKLITKEKPYLYFVATYGTTPGQTGYFANRILQKNSNSVDAYFGVKMPDNWTPMFDLSNKEKVRKINEKAELEIDAILSKIVKQESGDFMRRKPPLLIAQTYYRNYEKMRRTNNFWLTDTCVGCGICAKNCPINAIDIQNRKPVWTVDQCVMCLGCLHQCPKFSIQYGKNTQKHGQYKHPSVSIGIE